jgi:hypothetical protein
MMPVIQSLETHMRRFGVWTRRIAIVDYHARQIRYRTLPLLSVLGFGGEVERCHSSWDINLSFNHAVRVFWTAPQTSLHDACKQDAIGQGSGKMTPVYLYSKSTAFACTIAAYAWDDCHTAGLLVNHG